MSYFSMILYLKRLIVDDIKCESGSSLQLIHVKYTNCRLSEVVRCHAHKRIHTCSNTIIIATRLYRRLASVLFYTHVVHIYVGGQCASSYKF